MTVCYRDRSQRHNILRGRYVPFSKKDWLYWNYSCPYEWSKYNCIYQNSLEVAIYSSMLEFQPYECILPSFNAVKFMSHYYNRRVIFFGDSLLRQVMLSLSCFLHSKNQILSSEITWHPCGNAAFPWSCQRSEKCILCGQHSGFTKFSIQLKNQTDYGGMISFSEKIDDMLKQSYQSGDVVVVESGLHGEEMELINQLFHNIQQLRSKIDSDQYLIMPKIIWMVSWVPNFPTTFSNYNRTELSQLKSHDQSLNCKEKSTSYRLEKELSALNDIKPHLDGIIWLQDTDNQGLVKVGGANGENYGDCLHFCMPGNSLTG
jgi:hypothetical protein